jgi:hypothetical protein
MTLQNLHASGTTDLSHNLFASRIMLNSGDDPGESPHKGHRLFSRGMLDQCLPKDAHSFDGIQEPSRIRPFHSPLLIRTTSAKRRIPPDHVPKRETEASRHLSSKALGRPEFPRETIIDAVMFHVKHWNPGVAAGSGGT